jgi:hypothetical protein
MKHISSILFILPLLFSMHILLSAPRAAASPSEHPDLWYGSRVCQDR